jgi:hypothetical protein
MTFFLIPKDFSFSFLIFNKINFFNKTKMQHCPNCAHPLSQDGGDISHQWLIETDLTPVMTREIYESQTPAVQVALRNALFQNPPQGQPNGSFWRNGNIVRIVSPDHFHWLLLEPGYIINLPTLEYTDNSPEVDFFNDLYNTRNESISSSELSEPAPAPFPEHQYEHDSRNPYLGGRYQPRNSPL